jgi:DNA polymerase III epsilon subunit-like protein
LGLYGSARGAVSDHRPYRDPVRVHRYYPGLRSYSLGNLCAHYGIEFERHHRAMCDAEASARLLDLSLMATPPCTALARGIPRLRPRTLAI